METEGGIRNCNNGVGALNTSSRLFVRKVISHRTKSVGLRATYPSGIAGALMDSSILSRRCVQKLGGLNGVPSRLGGLLSSDRFCRLVTRHVMEEHLSTVTFVTTFPFSSVCPDLTIHINQKTQTPIIPPPAKVYSIHCP